MAIGNLPSLTGNVASKTISVTATASQTLFAVNGDIIDVSIAGGGGGGVGEPTGDVDGLFNYVAAASTITASITFDATNAGAYDSYVVSVVPNITIASGVGVTVGTGKTMVIDILQLGGL